MVSVYLLLIRFSDQIQRNFTLHYCSGEHLGFEGFDYFTD